MKTKKKEFTPEEKLTQSNQGFIKGRQLKTAGEKYFEKKLKYSSASKQNNIK
jgi:hypothetical protein